MSDCKKCKKQQLNDEELMGVDGRYGSIWEGVKEMLVLTGYFTLPHPN